MIRYNRFTLENGLRVLHHQDPDSTVSVLNILYNVGARDEDASRTGFAHLFEHLMFGGSVHVPSYDQHVENAGGSNNAFTNNDYTNYYITVPTENIETAFWLESDRMLQLAFSPKSLEVQRGVVIEEFRQRCFNAPFGQLWHHTRELLYKVHPYRWPTIGLDISHIEQATLEDVEAFYYKHYHPANAILCVAGNIELEETKRLCEKWFGSISRTGEVNQNAYPTEPAQTEPRMALKNDLSPNPAVFKIWRGPGYNDPKSARLEMFADMLGGSESSPMYIELVKKDGSFNAAECFYMRGADDGIFMVYGLLNEGVSHEEADQKLGTLLQHYLQADAFKEREFEAVKNKIASHLLFEKTSLMNRAQKLCYFEWLGNAEGVNLELAVYENNTLHDLIETAQTTLVPEKVSNLYYNPWS